MSGSGEPDPLERGSVALENSAWSQSSAPTWTPRAIHHRRVSAARARRRRLLAIDAAIAVALALIAIVLAPGVAVVALIALLVLAAYGASGFAGRVWRRRGERHSRR